MRSPFRGMKLFGRGRSRPENKDRNNSRTVTESDISVPATDPNKKKPTPTLPQPAPPGNPGSKPPGAKPTKEPKKPAVVNQTTVDHKPEGPPIMKHTRNAVSPPASAPAPVKPEPKPVPPKPRPAPKPSTNPEAKPVEISSDDTGSVEVKDPTVTKSVPPSKQIDKKAAPNSTKEDKEALVAQPDLEVEEAAKPAVTAYDSIPLLEQTKLPRGGISIETKSVGRVQYGIPPETIKDSMQLGLPVPQVYIVPVDRFCREMGPALGVNLAEFEFPAYFNFFVYKKRCTLVVDSEDAEENIRRVFSETLLGPAQFRREVDPIAYQEEDFAPEFPREAIPNFTKELQHFRIMPDGKELVIETLLDFRHFEAGTEGHEHLGIPKDLDKDEVEAGHESFLVEDEESEEDEEGEVPKNITEVEKREKSRPWTYSHTSFMGDVATVWPTSATPEQIKERSVPRVEIFKMQAGTEYIIHDIDEKNHIIGKARFLGHVKVSELMSVDGFGGHSILDDVGPNTQNKKDPTEDEGSLNELALEGGSPSLEPPTFHPPSFGVTVLGNSHGFDKTGSVSGYVLWVNGRGVMIDPPPYSSATLERKGIRPRTIVGIILTHCHADHDAGAFQKVLTGSPVVVITTPTIYKSFIRKYAALSALSPALLRHSHRYKPAVIGQPLRFQGATFHFTYTLHTIPCVGFRVEWRGRSMVFTGDHMNIPERIDELQAKSVLSRARADDLRSLPLQETDALLHESGAPPIHTPLDVLLKLPERVKKRLYVVHTSALPEGCELRVAPTGTAGTIRLDQFNKSPTLTEQLMKQRGSRDNTSSLSLVDDEFTWNGYSEYSTINEATVAENNAEGLMASSFSHIQHNVPTSRKTRANSVFMGDAPSAPLVSLRPASSTDAWFILNLLSAVPFVSSLSYTSTMELLETARVDVYSLHDVIVHSSRRSQVLCVVWEGTCSERRASNKTYARRQPLKPIDEENERGAVWHAGDWTGPISLQPEKRLSGESESNKTHDVVAVSSEGVKVITVDFQSLDAILKNGSPLYRKYLARKAHQESAKKDTTAGETEALLDDAMKELNVLELLNCNSALRKLNAVQKRHLESLAEGPTIFHAGERLWRAGTPVDRAFLIVSGTSSFVPKRRNAGSAMSQINNDKDRVGDPNLGDSMRVDAMKAMKELGVKDNASEESSMESGNSREPASQSPLPVQQIHFDAIFNRAQRQDRDNSLPDANDYAKLSRGLKKRADYLTQEGSEGEFSVGEYSQDDGDSFDVDNESQLDYTFTEDADAGGRSRRTSVIRRRSSRARFANKVLGRLYSRRAFTGGLVFSRGHFLGDVSKMVAGLLATDALTEVDPDAGPSYGFGDNKEGEEVRRKNDGAVLESVSEMVIHEQEGDHHIMHSSTLTAGKDGCVVLIFPKASLIPFLDEYPGLLLSLLGTQVVV